MVMWMTCRSGWELNMEDTHEDTKATRLVATHQMGLLVLCCLKGTLKCHLSVIVLGIHCILWHLSSSFFFFSLSWIAQIFSFLKTFSKTTSTHKLDRFNYYCRSEMWWLFVSVFTYQLFGRIVSDDRHTMWKKALCLLFILTQTSSSNKNHAGRVIPSDTKLWC